jgi:hypothetical protein
LSKQFDNNNNNVAVEENFQRRFSVNVWCGIFGDRLVGPFFIDSSLNQTKYHYLLSNEISNFLDEIPLAVLNRVVFHQDGAIPHNAHMNFVFLNRLNYVGER